MHISSTHYLQTNNSLCYTCCCPAFIIPGPAPWRRWRCSGQGWSGWSCWRCPKNDGFPMVSPKMCGFNKEQTSSPKFGGFLGVYLYNPKHGFFHGGFNEQRMGGLFRFFFPPEMIGSCDTQTKNIQEPFLEYDHHSLLNGSQDSNIQALVCSPETWGSGHRFCWGPVESGQSEPR